MVNLDVFAQIPEAAGKVVGRFRSTRMQGRGGRNPWPELRLVDVMAGRGPGIGSQVLGRDCVSCRFRERFH